MAFTRDLPNAQRILTQRFKLNPVWNSLFKSVNKVLHEQVVQKRWQLERIRDPQIIHRGDFVAVPYESDRALVLGFRKDLENNENLYVELPGKGAVELSLPQTSETREVHERNLQVSIARNLGFDFFSDKLTQDDYVRINRYISLFWPESGTDNFAFFLGYIKNMRLYVEELWTREYTGDLLEDDAYPYLEPKSEDSVSVGGIEWMTSHVQLVYDALEVPNPDVEDLIPLFYLLAPIHLVLERLVASVWGGIEWYYMITGQIHTMQGSLHSWANYGEVEIPTLLAGQVHIYVGSTSDSDTDVPNSTTPDLVINV